MQLLTNSLLLYTLLYTRARWGLCVVLGVSSVVVVWRPRWCGSFRAGAVVLSGVLGVVVGVPSVWWCGVLGGCGSFRAGVVVLSGALGVVVGVSSVVVSGALGGVGGALGVLGGIYADDHPPQAGTRKAPLCGGGLSCEFNVARRD